MVRMLCVCALAVVALIGPSAPLSAAPLQLQWEDLVPKLEPLKDPLAHLTPEQALALDTVAWARELSEEERKLDYNQDGIEDAKKFERELTRSGIDIDRLVREYAEWKVELARRDKIVRNDLNGKVARISGYLLPLSFSEEGETEFLLVPYVGACIHAPAPPANQIIFVHSEQPYKVDDLFTPVWVTGAMKTKSTSKTLTLVDGSADVSIGYHVADATVEPYSIE